METTCSAGGHQDASCFSDYDAEEHLSETSCYRAFASPKRVTDHLVVTLISSPTFPLSHGALGSEAS